METMRLAAAVAAALLILSGGSDDGHAAAQTATPDEDVRLFLVSIERIVRSSDAAAYRARLAASADPERAAAFIDGEIRPGITRAVIRERDRRPLTNVLPGDGYSLIVDAFEEFGAQARSATWRLDIERSDESSRGETAWSIVDQERLSSVEALTQLALNPTTQFTARDLRIRDEDLDLALADGSVFVSTTDQGTTAIVLAGRGTMTFRPTLDTEKSQVKIFAGAETLETPFDVAFVRINPVDFDRLVSGGHLMARPVDPREFRQADKVFREESPKSYGLDLGDLSRETWSLVPSPGDLVAAIRTRRFDTLTYTHIWSESEDIGLVDRKHHKTIAGYPSRRKRATVGSAGAEDERAGYEVLHYDMELSAAPARQWIDAQARMLLRVRAHAISNFILRLAEPLVVRSVVSDEYGRLFSMRVKNQNSVVVNLPSTLLQDTEFTITVTYAGRVDPEALTSEAIALQRPGGAPPPLDDVIAIDLEPSFLYSHRSNWYPEAPSGGFMTATLRIMVPADLDCVASGELEVGSPVLVPAKDPSLARKLYVFVARQPLRYLAFIVSRFAKVQNVEVAFPPSADGTAAALSGTLYRALTVSVAANPRQLDRGRDFSDRAVDIARFYQSLLDDSPYPSFTVALVENDRPGGHSPGYFAVVNQTLPTSPNIWRNDPVSFDRYPDFFLAHEMAHQWWGQAVGWRDYHEQWLSEGLSQYFAALYAKHQLGDEVFAGLMRQMRKWAKDKSDEGPISLGYRLGHIRDDSKVFRAIVYNKSAVVLHMLRQLVGEDRFVRGLRRFYQQSRFLDAGTDELKAAMEAETGQPLTRFFDRWIYGSALPQIMFGYRIEGNEAVLHVEQIGELFDLPLTVTLQYANRTSSDVVVQVVERVVDVRVPLASPLRVAEISKDDMSLAHLVKN